MYHHPQFNFLSDTQVLERAEARRYLRVSALDGGASIVPPEPEAINN
ncbi:hypothetical protein [Vulcanisaeta distributa]|nr:hypothetical protein [Vulcanisaeta distributa]